MLGRQRESFIQRVGVQRLRSAENGRQSLNGDSDDVVVRLLGGEGTAGGLRVKSKDRRFRILTLEPFGHHLVPDLSRRTILGNFFEQIVVGVEEKREPRSKF